MVFLKKQKERNERLRERLCEKKEKHNEQLNE
jgi:hypothetical protein